jgi:hypothetical protein
MRMASCIVLGVLLVFPVCTAAGAAWQAGMIDDEGGPVMQAYVEAGTGDDPAELRLQCIAGSQIGVRYTSGSELSADIELPSNGPVMFSLAIDGGDTKNSDAA